jgi:hypothetical protein
MSYLHNRIRIKRILHHFAGIRELKKRCLHVQVCYG